MPNIPSVRLDPPPKPMYTPIDLLQYRRGCQNLPIKVKDAFRFGNSPETLVIFFVADLQPGYIVKFLDQPPFEKRIGDDVWAKYVHARVNGFDCVISWNDIVWSNPTDSPDEPINEFARQLYSCDKPGMFEELLFDHVYRVSKIVALKRVQFDRETGTPKMVVKRDENGLPLIDEDGCPILECVYVTVQKPLIIRI